MSKSLEAHVRSLDDELEQLNAIQDKTDALLFFYDALPGRQAEQSHEGTESGKDQTRESDRSWASLLVNVVKKHKLGHVFFDWVSRRMDSETTTEVTLRFMPCANLDALKDGTCRRKGEKVCSGCKLVAYCSSECQSTHWRAHKLDCKDPHRAADWAPAWVLENRSFPAFTGVPTSINLGGREMPPGLGRTVWGKPPAVDTLNLPKNEGADTKERDFSLAYVSSGDLRNVIRTVNTLPQDYSGHLTVLMNDESYFIVLRDLLILIILSSYDKNTDKNTKSIEIALHLWYSAFLRPSARRFIQHAAAHLAHSFTGNSFSAKLGRHSTLNGLLTDSTYKILTTMDLWDLQPQKAAEDYKSVRFAPSRIDDRHCGYALLDPSHRLATLRYHECGVILPFGVAKSDFTLPNQFLFLHPNKWLSDDKADPLGSWNIEEVVDVGKSHGVPSADLYGCLYFFLSDELRMFAERLNTFHISFHVFDQKPQNLAKSIRSGVFEPNGVPHQCSFDRIDISNTIESVGIASLLVDWAPMLNDANAHASILGFALEWTAILPDRQTHMADVFKGMETLAKLGKLSSIRDIALTPAFVKYATVTTDNSALFEKFLQDGGIEEAAQKAAVSRKSRHTIVPHRLYAPLDGSVDALPDLHTKKSLYLNIGVGKADLRERSVEFCRV